MFCLIGYLYFVLWQEECQKNETADWKALYFEMFNRLGVLCLGSQKKLTVKIVWFYQIDSSFSILCLVMPDRALFRIELVFYPNVTRFFIFSSEKSEAMFLKDSDEYLLYGIGEFSHLIKEKGATVSLFNETFMGIVRPCECALSMSKQDDFY